MKPTTKIAAAGILGVLLLSGAWRSAGWAGEEKGREKPAPTTKYAGPETCKGCHPAEYKVWAGSNHGRSFVSLGTAMGRKIAADPTAYPGMPSAMMMKQCSPCHARGMDVPREARGKFHPEDGVQCEVCHGPGGHYAVEEVMRDPVKRKEAGLGKPKPEGCLECHKAKESHMVLGRAPFDFEKYWAKIRHGKSAAAKKS
jgi:hypothetical protein